MIKWLFIFLLLSSELASARLYCAQDINNCPEVDFSCQVSKQVLKNIFDSQDKWSEFLNVDASANNSVSFEAKGQYCRHLGYSGEVMAEIGIKVLINTSNHQKYEVQYTGCGERSFFTEHWEVKGENLKHLDTLVQRDIYLHKKRVITLSANENYKDFYLTSNVDRYKVPEKYFSFGSIHADTIYRSTYKKEDKKVISNVWLFDKKLFTQTLDMKNNPLNFSFESPLYSFEKRWNSNFSICFGSEVHFQKDSKGKELIYSSKDSSKNGMPYETFKKSCARVETLGYLDNAKDLFTLFFEKHIPSFASDVAEDKNKKLRKEIEEIITFAEAGDREVTLQRLRQLLHDVKTEKILDVR